MSRAQANLGSTTPMSKRKSPPWLARPPPGGARRWTIALLEQAAQAQTVTAPISRETVRRLLKKLPQAVVAQTDVVHRHADTGVSAADGRSARSFARPYQMGEPVVCLDEKSKQLLKDSRTPLPIRPGTPVR